MKLDKIIRKHTTTPPIFADLVLDMPDGDCYRVDVEHPGWLDEVRPALKSSKRVGLVMRDSDVIQVWLDVNGDEPQYFSRVIGQLGLNSAAGPQIRVAGLTSGAVSVWLHRDGLVEVGAEPTWRE